MSPVAFSRLIKITAWVVVSMAWGADVGRAEQPPAPPPSTPESDAEPPASPPKPERVEPRFNVWEYRVEGNSVLPRGAVENAVTPFLGSGKTLADVEQAARALEKVYRDNGYATVSVDIPEQDVVNGTVRLRVTEGRVERVRVKGSRYYLPSRIREKIPALAAGAVVHMPELQEQTAAVNRATADRQITPVFRAGDTPGTVAVDLRVKDEFPLHATLGLNNRYSANTERLRAEGSVRYDNLWQREHSLNFTYQTSPESTEQVRVFSATYLTHDETGKDITVWYGVKSDSDVSAVGDVSVVGKGEILGVRHILSLKGDRTFQHSLSLGFDSKNFKEDTELEGADSFSTPIHYYPLSLLYNASLPRPDSTSGYGLGLNFSLRQLSQQPMECFGLTLDQFDCKRVGAKANYFYLKWEAQHNQAWTPALSWNVRAEGQLSTQPLISNEQFTAGGVQSVRGYLESEAFGDEGLRTSVELRQELASESAGGKRELYGLAFLDSAWLRVRDPLPEQQARFDLIGTGLGLRFNGWWGFNGELHWGYAVRNAVQTREGDHRAHFKLEAGF